MGYGGSPHEQDASASPPQRPEIDGLGLNLRDRQRQARQQEDRLLKDHAWRRGKVPAHTGHLISPPPGCRWRASAPGRPDLSPEKFETAWTEKMTGVRAHLERSTATPSCNRGLEPAER